MTRTIHPRTHHSPGSRLVASNRLRCRSTPRLPGKSGTHSEHSNPESEVGRVTVRSAQHGPMSFGRIEKLTSG